MQCRNHCHLLVMDALTIHWKHLLGEARDCGMDSRLNFAFSGCCYLRKHAPVFHGPLRAAASLLPLQLPPSSPSLPSTRNPVMESRQAEWLVWLLIPSPLYLYDPTHSDQDIFLSTVSKNKPQEMSLNSLIPSNPPLTAGRGGDASPAFTAWEIRSLNLGMPSLYPCFPEPHNPGKAKLSTKSNKWSERAHATNWPETPQEKKWKEGRATQDFAHFHLQIFEFPESRFCNLDQVPGNRPTYDGCPSTYLVIM